MIILQSNVLKLDDTDTDTFLLNQLKVGIAEHNTYSELQNKQLKAYEQ